MEELLAHAQSQLRSAFAGRSVILAGGMAVGAARSIDQLRRLGAERFLVVASGAGTGALPEGADVELFDYEPGFAPDVIEGFREEERAIARPAAALLEELRRFDPRGDAIALAPPFLDVRELGDRRLFGARRPEWVAIEDKTRADELFDATGIPRPPSLVIRADASAIGRAAAALDRGMGTVWSGDARGGFNGGGEHVRWVRDGADQREALAFLVPRSDQVRIAEFVDGVPCSIHGFVVDDGVAAFRPVELVTLRAPSPPRLRYCGCATFFDPSPDDVATMRTAIRSIGEHLRATVGYRGAFTLDGIASPDGWVATECNPRFGAGLGYVDGALVDLCFLMLHYAVVEGVADVPSTALEAAVVEAGAHTRWGGAWTQSIRPFAETSRLALCGGLDGFRYAIGDEPPDAILSTGPGRTGGHVRFEPDAVRTPAGPSIAPLAVAGFAFADVNFDLGIGPLEAACPAG
jgi:hypothetical protein